MIEPGFNTTAGVKLYSVLGVYGILTFRCHPLHFPFHYPGPILAVGYCHWLQLFLQLSICPCAFVSVSTPEFFRVITRSASNHTFGNGTCKITPRKQSSWGQHGAHLGPAGPRWAPFWPPEPCYQGLY